MSATVPAPLATIAERLQCPVCSQRLAPTSGVLVCPHGHGFDVARHGYVTLAPPGGRFAVGDDAGTVAARAAVQAAGHFEPLTEVLAEEGHIVGDTDGAIILDIGSGTGHHLAGILHTLPHATGVALDASRAASRRAARKHQRIAAVRGDVWRQIPLRDGSVDLALNVFAPRNGSELARVLAPGGTLIVVTPSPDHLRELAGLHAVRVDPAKSERVHRRLAPALQPGGVRRLTWTLELTRRDAEAVLRMGPAGQHLRPNVERRLAELPEPVRVTSAVELRAFDDPRVVAQTAMRPSITLAELPFGTDLKHRYGVAVAACRRSRPRARADVSQLGLLSCLVECM